MPKISQYVEYYNRYTTDHLQGMLDRKKAGKQGVKERDQIHAIVFIICHMRGMHVRTSHTDDDKRTKLRINQKRYVKKPRGKK